MLDPLPAPPAWLSNLTASASSRLSFPTLPLHVHQIIISFVFYQFVQTVVSPLLSSYLFPTVYPQLNHRTKINWDVHVVSLVQSCSVNTLALWVMWVDQERKEMNSLERVYGYTGGCGMIQGLAAGYFLWDLLVTSRNIRIFGVGMWAHAVCALCVFSFGFRPFLNFYGPTFVLYELSSPFLNIHWFLDKVHLTGSKYQWYNGIVLLATFFGCRLVWGTYQSIRVYQDVWAALHLPLDNTGHLLLEADLIRANVTSAVAESLLMPRDGGLCLGRAECIKAQSEIVRFVGPATMGIPVWLAITYLSSNVVLNSLNFYWFGKMIETVRKRFDKKENPYEKKKGSSETVMEGVNGIDNNNSKKNMSNGDKVAHHDREDGTTTTTTGLRRRRPSIILDVADGLKRDEQLHLVMDGVTDADVDADAENIASTEQSRIIENRLEEIGQKSADMLRQLRRKERGRRHPNGVVVAS